MINTYRECRDLGRMLEDRQRRGREAYVEALEQICTLRRAGEIGDDFSLRNLFECTVPDGHEALREMEERRRLGVNVLAEAGGDAITTATFSNIMGQIAYADVLDNFENAEFIGDRLMTTVPATTGQREVIPGVTLIGDQAEKVGENEEYPIASIGEQYVIVPEIYKHGFIMNITEEAIFEDKTGLLMQRFNQVAEAMAINLEKERLNVALGITSTYSRNGGAIQATYANTHTNGDGDNLIASNPLFDRTSLANAKNAWNDLTDPDTGEPISMGRAYQIVVPDALEWTLGDLLSAREYQTTPALGASAIRMTTGNPINMGGRTYEPLSNQYVSTITSSDTTGFIGNFDKACGERVIYPTRVEMQDRTSELGFSRDVVSRVKVKRRSIPFVRDWRYVQKHTA